MQLLKTLSTTITALSKDQLKRSKFTFEADISKFPPKKQSQKNDKDRKIIQFF